MVAVVSARVRVGSKAWEQAGGPPLTSGQKIAHLAGAARLVTAHTARKLGWSLGLLKKQRAIDEAAFAPPDSAVARRAEQHLRAVSSPQMVNHSLRLHAFSIVAYELSGSSVALDREALYVAAVLHDVGLFDANPAPHEHCFTVSCAREARRITGEGGWPEARQDLAAVAITSNPSSTIPLEVFGAEAHFLSVGGMIEVLGQEWALNAANLRQILARFPRDGFAEDALAHVKRETVRRPHCRFAVVDPIFPFMVRRAEFSPAARLGPGP